jgi:hypothetical protein
VARKTGLPIQQIADFSRPDGGGSLGKAPQVIEAAFSPDVLDGHLSAIVEVTKGRGVVLTAGDHKMPQEKPLDAVRTEIVAAWKKERGSELARAAADAAVKQLQQGASWDTVAKSLGGNVPASQLAPHFVSRSDSVVPREVQSAVFSAPRPGDKPVYEALSLADGDAALFGLLAVREDPDHAAETDVAMRRQFSQEIASAEAQSYAAAARADAKIVLNPQAID